MKLVLVCLLLALGGCAHSIPKGYHEEIIEWTTIRADGMPEWHSATLMVKDK